ncbi:MAG: hypothetical protein IJY74_02310, partial [Oscillospiraceae bacterium]|nr:hypothetical protein [Oscillospiraceae bacterium]
MNQYEPFAKAKPVWGDDLQTKKNCQIGFVATVSAKSNSIQIRIATAGYYSIFVNGEFVHYGPARAAKGYFRVDIAEIPVNIGNNWIAICAMNPCITSFGLIGQSAFLQAELVQDNDILAATGSDENDFTAYVLTERVKKIQRYSFQRPFAEGYILYPGYRNWMVGKPCDNAVLCKIVIEKTKTLLPRGLQSAVFPVAYMQN